MTAGLEFFHRPESIAVVGASDDPEKIGGRPLRYLREFGYGGQVIPVNPRRPGVQGLPAVAALRDAPVVPDVALIALPGRAAADAVAEAAELGVRGCIVMSSGFGESALADGERLQRDMIAQARRTGMRIVGPNSQGLANFATGAVMGFSTLFTEEPPADGPVAVVSQSGGMCSVAYGMLRRRGIGVRYAHGTGNDADVSAAEIALSVLDDPEVRLLILYLENVGDPRTLALLGEKSRSQGVPVVALVGGRTVNGSRAAASHTGALATERRVLDAFFERVGIWQVHSVGDLLAATELYLADWRPAGERMAIVSNSGAFCVLAADAADDHQLTLAQLAPSTVNKLVETLPDFATMTNPIDVTAALMTDSALLGTVLAALAEDQNVDAVLLGIPVAGRGYDVAKFAAATATFAATGKPIVTAVAQPAVAQHFHAAHVPVFSDETAAVAALAQYLGHLRRMHRAEALPRPSLSVHGPGETRQLNEVNSLRALAELGIPVVEHEYGRTVSEVAPAIERLGAASVAVKGCSAAVSHKSELGLVRLGLESKESATEAAEQIRAAARDHSVELDGFIIATMIRGLHEVLIGAHHDPTFGPVVVVGAGGTYVEVLPDTQILLPPCTAAEVHEAIERLRIAPLLAGVRGEPPADVDAWVKAVVRVSEAVVDPKSTVAGFDANPVMLMAAGAGAVTVDAVVLERATSTPEVAR